MRTFGLHRSWIMVFVLALFSACAHPRPSQAAPVASDPLIFGLAADAGRWNANSEATRDSMLKLHVHRLVMAGDNIYEPHKSYAEAWKHWTEKGFTFDVVAIGNHTLGYGAEIDFFKMPSEYYAKVYPGIRFLVLNSDNTKNVKEQLHWLEGELKSAREPLVFVVLHHPTYTISTQGHLWTEKKVLQEGLRKLLHEHRSHVTALIAGHDHLAVLARAGDLPIVISGAIQETRKDMQVDQDEQGTHVKTLYYFGTVPTWVRLTPTAGHPDEATIDYIRSSDSLITCTAKLTTGKAPEPQPNCPKPPEAP